MGIDQAEEIVSKAASQGVTWWGTALTIGSLTCVFLVMRKMLANHRYLIEKFLAKIEEKDKEIQRLNDRLFELLNDRRGSSVNK